MPQSLKNHYFNFAAASPKIAFLFIARNRLSLDFVWQRFFQGAEESKFSIYIHSRPGFVFSKGTTRCKYFYGRQLSDSIQVDWGEASMIEAERILLRKALQDPLNQRFVFVSDSCVPLYNFSYIYDYIMSSPKSFVDSFSDTKEGRYNPKMSGVIPVEKWRKGSQWATLIRKHAEVVAADNAVFPAFQLHCKRKPLPEFWRQEAVVADTSKIHNCIPDEHYVQTLLAMKGLEGEINRRTVTYTLWKAGKARERQGWHPMTFKYADATANLTSDIKGIDHIYYETEYRTEWCSTNEKFCPCFLFARKFSRGAAFHLLNQTLLVV
ncbi:glycosyltransferase BC10 isoform X2 [Cryptomeria japonica]|nr:glycosyltransferase BC10 isoform X2 [Cryptomeria japonica]